MSDVFLVNGEAQKVDLLNRWFVAGRIANAFIDGHALQKRPRGNQLITYLFYNATPVICTFQQSNNPTIQQSNNPEESDFSILNSNVLPYFEFHSKRLLFWWVVSGEAWSAKGWFVESFICGGSHCKCFYRWARFAKALQGGLL